MKPDETGKVIVELVVPHASNAERIAAFVEQKRHEAGLVANPSASAGVLIRRVHYDLTGLPRDAAVKVFTLAYGSSADVDTLQQIASATGAQFYDATDPTEVTAILGDESAP